MIDPAVVEANVSDLRDVIDRHATRPVRLVAVTKRFGAEAVHAALAAGVEDVGENYAQELVAKAQEVATSGAEPTWHFIGHVQRNKVKLLAPWVSLWHAVDSVRLGAEIAKRAAGAAVLVQVNATGAETQSGVAPPEVPALVDELRSLDLQVRGLMTIGAMGDLERSRAEFRSIRALADSLELPECSMGMSGDLEAALEEGSTMIRVGTTIFGPRPVG